MGRGQLRLSHLARRKQSCKNWDTLLSRVASTDSGKNIVFLPGHRRPHTRAKKQADCTKSCEPVEHAPGSGYNRKLESQMM